MNKEPVLDFRSTNALWASVLVETLVRTGVRRAVISPGSRSTPVTLALARNPAIKTVAVLDERSAAFFALGMAKASGVPVVLVCTSGTAGANYFPAVIEAHEGGVPLIVITADRPPEMRDCASGQTIDQQKLFGSYVGFYHELALPQATESRLRYLRQVVLHACGRTLAPVRGPVHLNAPFRDPLVPPEDGSGVVEVTIDWKRFFAHVGVAPQAERAAGLPELASVDRGIIVVGNESFGSSLPSVVGELARKLGWPVITDGLSELRNHAARVPNVVSTADLILRNPNLAERLAPEAVVCVGGWPTSKVLRAWLEEVDPAIWMFSERLGDRDALHGRTRHGAGLRTFVEEMPDSGAPRTTYAQLWADGEAKARAALDAQLASMSERFEGKAAWLLARHLPPDTTLFVANSMPVRDVEYFWPPNDRRARLFCNRGANGIDGTLSTAMGVAQASGGPSVLLTGDLALLHDTNGFLLTPKLRGSLTIVLINNNGGGIFGHLPVAKAGAAFEEFFATPQHVHFGSLMAAYGVQHTTVRDWNHFAALISQLPAAGVRVLELATDRKRDAENRKRLFAGIAAALAGN
jgi:2-succinyl-5-enolpyruvyl-6-hydroxy-3-cyclohexene-1-carboxylate synthase